jgi:hypothetical protein
LVTMKPMVFYLKQVHLNDSMWDLTLMVNLNMEPLYL